jgi:hypothetical protein
VGCQYVHDSPDLVANNEAMLSGTTLADVTQDKGDRSKIDDTYKGVSEEQTAQSKFLGRHALASTIKGLIDRR